MDGIDQQNPEMASMPKLQSRIDMTGKSEFKESSRPGRDGESGRSSRDRYGESGRSSRHRDGDSGRSSRHRDGESGRSSRHRDGESGRSSRHRDGESRRSSRPRDGESSSRRRDGESGRSSRHRDGDSGRSSRHRDGESRRSSRPRDGESGRSSRHRDGESRRSSRPRDGESGRSSRHRDGDSGRSSRHRDGESGRSSRPRDGESSSRPRDGESGRSSRHRDGDSGRSSRHRDGESGRSSRPRQGESGRSSRHRDDEHEESSRAHNGKSGRSSRPREGELVTADQRAKMRERRARRERSPRPGAMSVSSDDPSAYREKRKNNRRMSSGDRSMRSKEEHSTPQERADRRIKARAREGRSSRPGAVPGRHNDASAVRESKKNSHRQRRREESKSTDRVSSHSSPPNGTTGASDQPSLGIPEQELKEETIEAQVVESGDLEAMQSLRTIEQNINRQMNDLYKQQMDMQMQAETKQERAKKSRNSKSRKLCVLALVAIIAIGGGVAAYLVRKKNEADPTNNPTPNPSSSPTITNIYDPPNASECTAISYGFRDWQSGLFSKSFELKLEITLQSGSSIANVLDSLKSSIQQKLIPELAGCPASRRSLAGFRGHHRMLEVPNYVIYNGLVLSVRSNDEESCADATDDSCHRVDLSMDLWVKENVKNYLLVAMLGEAFEPSVIERLGMQTLIKTTVTIDVQFTTPTESPSKSPTFSPTTKNPTAMPVASTEAPTRKPTPAPTTRAPTRAPVPGVTNSPTRFPTPMPTPLPTPMPTRLPTPLPTPMPTPSPTPAPTTQPWANYVADKYGSEGYSISDDEFRDYIQESSHKIIYRWCPNCTPSHKNIFYKRLTPLPPPDAFPQPIETAAESFLDLFLNNWSDRPKNNFQQDFKLYSTYEDALNGVHEWQFCNFNGGFRVGFPRDCNVVNHPVQYQWNSFDGWVINVGKHHRRIETIASNISSPELSSRLRPEDVAKNVEEALATSPIGDSGKEQGGEEIENDSASSCLEPTPLKDGKFDQDEDPVRLFSDEDLVTALLSIGDEESEEIKKPAPPTSTTTSFLEPLPDIELSNEEKDAFIDSDQFIDPSNLESAFEDLIQEENVDNDLSAIDDLDLDTEVLYQELAKLFLGSTAPQPDKSSLPKDATPSEIKSSFADDLVQELPFCLPCSQDESYPVLLPSVESDEEEEAVNLEELDAAAKNNSTDDELVDDLLKLEFLKLEDTMQHQSQEAAYEQAHHEYPSCTPVRQEAWNAASGIFEGFGIDSEPFQDSSSGKPCKKETTCFGHKERIFGVAFSDCGSFCATAAQDSTINIWHVEKNKLLTSLKDHSKAFECLRVTWASSSWASDILDRNGDYKYLLASSGADGTVRLWACKDPLIKQGEDGSWKCHSTIDHSVWREDPNGEAARKKANLETIKEDNDDEDDEDEDKEKPDKPQVYSLQFINHWNVFNTSSSQGKNSFLMTSSDDYIHLWEIDDTGTPKVDQEISLDGEKAIEIPVDNSIRMKEVMSLHFGPVEHYGFGVDVCNVTGSGLQVQTAPTPPDLAGTGFGGERNPNNLIFVFDAAYNENNGLLGVALADGSLRLVNGRGVCVSILNLPGCESHLTSFAWDTSGTRLATCVATGHLITWHLDLDPRGRTVATCTAIMEGGHQVGRPLFGCCYCGGENEDLLLSWSIDGSLCLWDSYSEGNVNEPMAILRKEDSYPIYAVEMSKNGCIAVGGGADQSFVGIPLYLYACTSLSNEKAPICLPAS